MDILLQTQPASIIVSLCELPSIPSSAYGVDDSIVVLTPCFRCIVYDKQTLTFYLRIPSAQLVLRVFPILRTCLFAPLNAEKSGYGYPSTRFPYPLCYGRVLSYWLLQITIRSIFHLTDVNALVKAFLVTAFALCLQVLQHIPFDPVLDDPIPTGMAELAKTPQNTPTGKIRSGIEFPFDLPIR